MDLKNVKSNTLFCNESGSTLRFLIPLCLLNNEKLTEIRNIFKSSRVKIEVYTDINKDSQKVNTINSELNKQSLHTF